MYTQKMEHSNNQTPLHKNHNKRYKNLKEKHQNLNLIHNNLLDRHRNLEKEYYCLSAKFKKLMEENKLLKNENGRMKQELEQKQNDEKYHDEVFETLNGSCNQNGVASDSSGFFNDPVVGSSKRVSFKEYVDRQSLVSETSKNKKFQNKTEQQKTDHTGNNSKQNTIKPKLHPKDAKRSITITTKLRNTSTDSGNSSTVVRPEQDLSYLFKPPVENVSSTPRQECVQQNLVKLNELTKILEKINGKIR